MRVAVIGAGAIGGFVAAALARSGTEVAVVARGEHLAEIQRAGITLLESDLGPFVARVAAGDDLRRLGSFDVAVLTFKGHQWPELLPQILALRESDVPIVTFQNGVPFWFVREPALQSVDPGGRIGAAFADDRIFGGVVHVSGHIVRPGTLHQSGGMRYALGTPGGNADSRLDAFERSMRDAGLDPYVVPNVRELIWLKLVNNAGLNSISTLRGLTIREMLEDARAGEEVRELMAEALAVGVALGVVGEVDIEARLAYARRLGDVKTSMLQDFEAGRALELDPILGALVELGERLDVPVPHLRQTYDRLARASARSS